LANTGAILINIFTYTIYCFETYYCHEYAYLKKRSLTLNSTESIICAVNKIFHRFVVANEWPFVSLAVFLSALFQNDSALVNLYL